MNLLNKNENAIFLWPEGSYSFIKNKNLKKIFQDKFKNNQKIILGATTKDKNGNIFNSLVALNSEGKIINNYNKMHLVPFGEFIPFENLIEIFKSKKSNFRLSIFFKRKK